MLHGIFILSNQNPADADQHFHPQCAQQGDRFLLFWEKFGGGADTMHALSGFVCGQDKKNVADLLYLSISGRSRLHRIFDGFPFVLSRWWYWYE